MQSRRALMTGAAGLMVAVSGCTDLLGGGNTALLNLTASNQTTEDELTTRIVIQDDGETIFNQEYELEQADEQPSLTLDGIIEAQDGVELTARVLLSDHDHEEVASFTIDCPADVQEGGVTTNDNLFVSITETDAVDISHNGCA